MADFDQFASAEPTQNEADPVADFLMREQDQLAELDDNFGMDVYIDIMYIIINNIRGGCH